MLPVGREKMVAVEDYTGYLCRFLDFAPFLTGLMSETVSEQYFFDILNKTLWDYLS